MLDEQIKYIGCIGIETSMRSLDPQTRSEVVKESINRLCKANKIARRSDSKTNADVELMLHGEPNLKHSGTNVQLCISSTHLNVISEETGKIIIQHEMPNVSFASKGDDDTVDFVAYVAKDEIYGRACFVLECGLNTGMKVLYSIAQGFQERTKQTPFSCNTLSMKSPTLSHDHHRFSSTRGPNGHFRATDPLSASLDNSLKNDEENRAEIRASLEREPWFHGSYLPREASETRLKEDGDFLVRESILDPGHYVLSVMHNGTKLHLLFDDISGQVKTREKVFRDISHLIRYHHGSNLPIVADNRVVFLRNGVPSTSRSK